MEDVEDIYELSPMQQGMLFHTLYAPGSAVYFEQSSLPISGVNVSGFVRAWQEVINRHPILRTSFFWDDLEKPLQVVHRQVKLPLDQQDWRGFSMAEQEQQLASHLQADRARGFDLSVAPLLRVSLFRLTAEVYQFVLSFHHMLLDGWSKHLLIREVVTLYEAYCWDREVKLESRRPYGEYIAWLQQQDMGEAETFWRRVLEGFESPTSFSGSQLSDLQGATDDFGQVETRLSKSVSDSLQELARSHQLTLNSIVQGAWGILLSHYSLEEDVLFGTIVSGRPPQLEGVESMIGLFINALALRLRVAPQSTILAYLQEAQRQHAEMRQYEYSPLVQVQAWSDVPSGVPLFNTLMVFENYPNSGSPAEGNQILDGGLNVSDFERTNYPLTILVAPGAKLWLKILYSKRHFDAATIERMLDHYARVLEEIAARPQRRLLDLELTSAAEQQLLLHDFNSPVIPPAASAVIYRLFELQAARTPEATALLGDGEQLSYAELNNRADCAARHLRTLGVGAETVVGICLPRSVQMLISVLAILKAGGAYMPLDPEYPEERISTIVRDAGLRLVISESKALSNKGVEVIEPWKLAEEHDAETSEHGVDVSGENLAYVLYTSGSTGQPKGVAMTHRALVNLLAWQIENFTSCAATQVLQFAPLSFDVSFQEIFSTWCSGGTIVLISEEQRRDAFHLLSFLEEQSIGRLFLPFVALQQLAEVNDEQDMFISNLREVITAGEQLQITPSIANFFRKHPDCILHNHYGPTESHVVTAYSLPGPPDDWRSLPPIGRPIRNIECYLLDAQLRLVPVGVAGELYVGGLGLARGYLNRPDLTAERFIPHPFSPEPDARLYRTGDLARYSPNGVLEFLGRSDQQVKVRGYRIELGEIEAALARHEAVDQAIVITRDLGGGAGRLVAYIIAHDNQEVGAGELRSYLSKILPEYMVPSFFMQMKAFPLTANGKVARRQLPDPVGESVLEYEEARTEVEQLLASMWREVLGIERVGVDDNFFRLGGHSLLATQLASRVRNSFQIDFPIKLIFESPTLRELATAVEEMLISEIEQVSESDVFRRLETEGDAFLM